MPVDVVASCIRRTRLGVGVTITVAPRTCSSSEPKLNKDDVMLVPIMRCTSMIVDAHAELRIRATSYRIAVRSIPDGGFSELVFGVEVYRESLRTVKMYVDLLRLYLELRYLGVECGRAAVQDGPRL